jgi:hypothetical protein
VASMEILEYHCEMENCFSRATRAIKSKGGNMVKKVCSRHAGEALKAQNEVEKSTPISVGTGLSVGTGAAR